MITIFHLKKNIMPLLIGTLLNSMNHSVMLTYTNISLDAWSVGARLPIAPIPSFGCWYTALRWEIGSFEMATLPKHQCGRDSWRITAGHGCYPGRFCIRPLPSSIRFDCESSIEPLTCFSEQSRLVTASDSGSEFSTKSCHCSRLSAASLVQFPFELRSQDCSPLP